MMEFGTLNRWMMFVKNNTACSDFIMVVDAEQVVRTCKGCQYYARQTHLPTKALYTIPVTWPFMA